MTHKAPTGAKHAPCSTHVEHAYPSNGWLCIDDEPGRADAMRAFADHLVDVAVRHHSTELERPSTIITDAARKVRPANPSPASTFDPSGLVWHSCSAAAAGVDRGRKVRSRYLNAAGQCPLCVDDRCATPAAQCTICKGEAGAPMHLSTYNYPAGRHAFTPPAAILEATPLVVDDARWQPVDLYTAADHRPIDPAPVPAPEPVQPAEPIDEPIDEPVVEPETVQPCLYTVGDEACDAGPIGHKGAHHYPTVQPCWYYRHTVGVPPIRCDAGPDGHDGAHRYPDTTLKPAPAVLAPVLTIVQPSSRPTCARCGQTFRQSGTGAEWHRVNRPDCAAGARPAVLAAI